jgi:2-iminobutanoate/2-iminopropanoate deaminase
LNPEGGLIENETIASQTNQVLNNLKAIVVSAGYTLDHVVKTTCYLTSMENFPAMNEVYATFFPLNPPARVTIEVSRLPKDALVEIDAIAVK